MSVVPTGLLSINENAYGHRLGRHLLRTTCPLEIDRHIDLRFCIRNERLGARFESRPWDIKQNFRIDSPEYPFFLADVRCNVVLAPELTCRFPTTRVYLSRLPMDRIEASPGLRSLSRHRKWSAPNRGGS